MHIAYTAINHSETKGREMSEDPTIKIRYQAYQQACKKHQQQIIQIQKYLPGWFPQFDQQY